MKRRNKKISSRQGTSKVFPANWIFDAGKSEAADLYDGTSLVGTIQGDSVLFKNAKYLGIENIRLLSGDDTIMMVGSTIQQSMLKSADMGSGNDLLLLDSCLLAASLEPAILRFGDGDDSCLIQSNSIIGGESEKHVDIRGDLGNDRIVADASTMLQFCDIDTGHGSDTLEIGDIKSVNISTGEGEDMITLLADTIQDTCLIALGNGNDALSLSGEMIHTYLHLDQGHDSIIADSLSRIVGSALNTSDGNDQLLLNMINDSFIHTGIGHDMLAAHPSGYNNIDLSEGDDHCKLQALPDSDSLIEGGLGRDNILINQSILFDGLNQYSLPYYTEKFSDTGDYIFTYFGTNEAPLFTLRNFESIEFLNASFTSTDINPSVNI